MCRISFDVKGIWEGEKDFKNSLSKVLLPGQP